MKCPHCQNDLKIPEHAKLSMAYYGKAVNIKTDCCHKIVKCFPRTVYEAFVSNLQEDDWGDTVEG